MEQSVAIPQDGEFLNEDQLRFMSRHVNKIVPRTAPTVEGINTIRRTLATVCETAAKPDLNAAHRVAAWNTLCALIDRCLDPAVPALHEVVVAENSHMRAFQIYIAQSHDARPKVLKQLLSTVSFALSVLSYDQPVSNDRDIVANSLVGHLVSGEDGSKAKASALALGHFVRKDTLDIASITRALEHLHGGSESVDDNTTLSHFLVILFGWLGRCDFGSVIGQLVAILLDKHGKNNSLWPSALIEAHRRSSIEISDLRVHILPLLFKRSFTDYINFLEDTGLNELLGDVPSPQDRSELDFDHELLYASLQTGKELGIVHETEELSTRIEDGILFIPVRSIERLVSSSSRTARLTGLSLLISSHTVTRPIPLRSLRVIKLHLGHAFADTDANFRGEVFSLLQRLMDRVRAITAVLARQISKPNPESDKARQTLQAHRSLIDQLLQLITWELRPTASYQRHISSLKCLAIIAKSGVDDSIPSSVLSKSALGEARWPFSSAVIPTEMQRMLLDVLVDPFDDVRQTAAAILLLRSLSLTLKRDLLIALDRAEKAMLATGRADQADGVAHIYTLLHHQRSQSFTCTGTDLADRVVPHLTESLESMLRIAQDDLSKAVQRYPIHGLLTSLRYVLTKHRLELTQDLYRRLGVCLREIWMVVKPILCNDAPEGYLPEELEANDEVSTKDTLSYCWRALKEASLLLGVLVSHPRAACTTDDVDVTPQSTSLAELCFVQLAELRHRGAFSTVAQTWSTCCIQCRDVQTKQSTSQLEVWYDRVVAILRSNSTINTRRSAGLPSLLCGVLVAERSDQLMQQAINDLEHIARQEVDVKSSGDGSLPQVHAMNCLKDVLKHSKLSERSEQYVARALQLAADALRSESWAIRNCGLMLFRAVIDRLFGTSEAVLEDEAQRRNKLSTDRHPQLFDIVLGQLSVVPVGPEHDLLSARYEGVFPALQLLQRLQIPSDRRTDVEEHVVSLMASPLWHVRDKAAQTYAALSGHEDAVNKLRDLLNTDARSQNALHGALLCAKYLVKHLTTKSNDREVASASPGLADAKVRVAKLVECCLSELIDATDRLFSSNHCFITRKAFLELYTTGLRALLLVGGTSKLGRPTMCTTNAERFQHELTPSLDTIGKTVKPDRLEEAVLAEMYALHWSLDLLSDDYEPHAATLDGMTFKDSDAFIAFMAVVQAHWNRVTTMRLATSYVLSVCCNVLYHAESPVRLRCEALRTLLIIIADKELHNQSLSELIAVVWLAQKSGHVTTNQACADLFFELQAAVIECRARPQNQHLAGSAHPPFMPRYSVTEDFMRWTSTCEDAMAGFGLRTREAVASAIDHFDTAWQLIAETASVKGLHLRLCVIVYDLLNDDDEDIRSIAARVAGRNLACEPSQYSPVDLAPLVASQRLMGFISRRWHGDAELARLALLRAFAIREQGSVSVYDRLKQYANPDDALFAEEKQNLYVDEAREIKMWSQVLLRHDLACFKWSDLKHLSEWTTEGIQILTTKLTQDDEGALGWTTNADTFTLGLQVVYATEFLLHLIACGRRLPVRASLLRRLLAKLTAAGRAAQGNCLWQSEIDRILATSVAHMFFAAKQVLRQLAPEVRTQSTK